MDVLIGRSFGGRCGGPVLLVGFVLGAGVVQLASGPLGQTSRFSLELLLLLMLKLTGPLLVAILAMALLLPFWISRPQPAARSALPLTVAAAALTGGLLQLLLMLAAVGGGLLASPRADLLGEWRDLLSGLQPVDLLRSMIRAALFLAAICAWTRWRSGNSTRSDPRSDHGLTLFPSNLLVEGLMVLMTLKLAWIMAIEPLNLSSSPQ